MLRSSKTVIRLILISAISLMIGTAIAYYNTASFGYDNANVFSISDESINIFDYHINRVQVREVIEFLKNLLPSRFFIA